MGTILVKAAGNQANNASLQEQGASRYNIMVAAAEDGAHPFKPAGYAADYSAHGPSILVTAPVSNLTTDLSGANGYTSGDYTSFNGTSSAAPAVSSVIALMLEANENLGWRDVQNILAASSTFTGSSYDAGPSASENGTW